MMCWNGKWWKVRGGKSGGRKSVIVIYLSLFIFGHYFLHYFLTSFSFSYYIFSIISFFLIQS